MFLEMNLLFLKIARLSRFERDFIAKMKATPMLRERSLIIRAPKDEPPKHFDMSYLSNFVDNMKIMLTNSTKADYDLEAIHDFLTCLTVHAAFQKTPSHLM
jgi:hypothetical protein